ncbi:MAG: permease-like cell division protein FtsX [Oscillospiraceae bacterium]|jgi:cell division transport system permease protein|nr:permease-like cell division protein FtsX [Oscillospiraceae bacterium]
MSGLGYLIKEGFHSIWNNKIMSIASIGVLFSCLILTGAAAMLSVNVSQAVENVGESNVTTVYLKNEVSSLQAVSVMRDIEKIDNVAGCEFYSKEDAIASFKGELDSVYEYMQGDANPLPNAIKVTMADLAKYDDTIKEIMKIEETDSYSNAGEVAKTLTRISSLIGNMSFWIILVLSIISLFIISNTIRATMYSRRYEISIMKSVGATNTFVRIPFIVEGMFIGLVSAVLSILGLMLLYNILMDLVQSTIPFDAIPFGSVAGVISLCFIVAGVGIGTLGALFSIGRYLKKEGNEILGW